MVNVVLHASSPLLPNTEGRVASVVHVVHVVESVESVEIAMAFGSVVAAPASTTLDASPLTDVAVPPSSLVLAMFVIAARNHAPEQAVAVMSGFGRSFPLDDGG